MITLTTATYLHEADMIRMRLEASGIKAFIPDQNTSSIQPLFSNAIGGIRIQIDENDLARAREVLKNALPQADRGIFECPACKSDAVTYEGISKQFAFLSLFLLGIPLLWRKRECRCGSCGHRWIEP
jgi:DNA-directed RNA polymerase subunit M/transcription elongation factor TFIIS